MNEILPPSQKPPQRTRLTSMLAGVMIDVIDLLSFGPIGFYLGPFLGAAAGWWAARELGFEGKKRWLIAIGVAVYCTTPATEFLPLGTIVGAFLRLGPRET